MGNATSYDPKKVSVNTNGSIDTGFASDGMITVTKSEDAVTPEVGLQGDVAYSENANESGTIVLTFQGTSASIAKYRKLCDSKKMFPILISDANDDDSIVISGKDCRVTKQPDIARGKTAGTVSVTIFVPELQIRQ